MNVSGPRKDPCGIPATISSHSERCFGIGQPRKLDTATPSIHNNLRLDLVVVPRIVDVLSAEESISSVWHRECDAVVTNAGRQYVDLHKIKQDKLDLS